VFYFSEASSYYGGHFEFGRTLMAHHCRSQWTSIIMTCS